MGVIVSYIPDVKEEELKPGCMKMEQWSKLSVVVENVQYSQYHIGHYALEVTVPEVRYGTKMYKKLQDSEKEIKAIF